MGETIEAPPKRVSRRVVEKTVHSTVNSKVLGILGTFFRRQTASFETGRTHASILQKKNASPRKLRDRKVFCGRHHPPTHPSHGVFRSWLLFPAIPYRVEEHQSVLTKTRMIFPLQDRAATLTLAKGDATDLSNKTWKEELAWQYRCISTCVLDTSITGDIIEQAGSTCTNVVSFRSVAGPIPYIPE